jgi:hypothetical protein
MAYLDNEGGVERQAAGFNVDDQVIVRQLAKAIIPSLPPRSGSVHDGPI